MPKSLIDVYADHKACDSDLFNPTDIVKFAEDIFKWIDNSPIVKKSFEEYFYDRTGYCDDHRKRDFIKQILKTGLCDSDIWNCDATISRLILPILKEYNHKAGDVISLNKKRKKAIRRMIRAFEIISEDVTSDDVAVDKGLKAFRNYIRHCWC